MLKLKTALTASRLRELLDYDHATGHLLWKVARSWNAREHDVAGVVDASRGYRKIKIEGARHLAHRLVWLHVHGTWPAGLIDHINGRRDDNRIENLREATRQCNAANSKRSKNNSSGFKGVSWHRSDRKWRATISVCGRQIFLGNFETKEYAHAAYLNAASRHFGDYASTGLAS